MRRLVLSFALLLVNAIGVHSSVDKANNEASKETPVNFAVNFDKPIEFDVLFNTADLAVTPSDMEAWSKVAMCEMGGKWDNQGPIYSGGLGILNTNWVAFGGLQYAPNAGLATPEQQVAVAKRINNGYSVPDQHGCGQGW